MTRRFVVAVTGASGATYAVRLLDVLTAAGCDVDLSISPAGREVLEHELDLRVDLERFDPAMLMLDRRRYGEDEKLKSVRALADVSSEDSNVLGVASGEPGAIRYHHHGDLAAPIASGSFLTDGMVICPCSMGTLGAIVHGTTANLIHRAADVHLKERRRLVVVPRETPLSAVQLENMRRAAEAGAVVLPAMPGFYHGVTGVGDLVDFVVARICDQLGVAHALMRRWGS
jgi:4-hydroxy-3-polyprenylbenzoate decarboxylase